MRAPPKINHEETKSAKIYFHSFFVFFVSSWLIFVVSWRHSLRHERLQSRAKKRQVKDKIFAPLRAVSWMIFVASERVVTSSESQVCWWTPEPSSGNPPARRASRHQPRCSRRVRQRTDRS